MFPSSRTPVVVVESISYLGHQVVASIVLYLDIDLDLFSKKKTGSSPSLECPMRDSSRVIGVVLNVLCSSFPRSKF